MTLLLLALAVPAHAGKMDFGWTPGQTADVTYTTTGTRATPIGPLSFERTVTFDLAVTDAGEGTLHIERTNREVRTNTVDPKVGNWDVQVLIDDLSDFAPTLVVGAEGDFQGIEGGDVVRSAAGGMLEAAEADEITRAHVDGIVSDESLAAVTGDWWSLLVKLADGVKADPGSVEKYKQTAGMPGLGGEVRIVLELTVGDLVPCVDGAEAAECITVSAVSSPNADDVAKVLGADPSIESLEMEQRTTLLTHPETLIPYKLETVRELKMRAAGPDGEMSDLGSEAVTRTWTFDWATPE